jgi:hypothetical protein
MRITQDSLDNIFKSKLVTVETMTFKGYYIVEELLADSSGFGSDNEPALTPNQLKCRVSSIIEEHGPVFATITDEGQFQVYIGIFKRDPNSLCKSKKVANNTLEVIDWEGSRHIRLHNTNVLTFKGDKITLNSGGYRTRTTKERINEFLPNGYHLSQKAFEWFLNGEPFTDGMELTTNG